MISVRRTAKMDRLASVPLFRACRDSELRAVSRILDEVVLRPGDVVVAGTPERELVIIAGGTALGRAGRIFRSGDVFGLPVPRGGTGPVVAASEMRLFVGDARRVEALFAAAPVVAVRLLRRAAASLDDDPSRSRRGAGQMKSRRRSGISSSGGCVSSSGMPPS